MPRPASAIALIAFLTAPAVEANPSFDCRKATMAAEHAICANSVLSSMDRMLGARYAELRRNADPVLAADLRRVQRAWLTVRNRCRWDRDCLEVAYLVRLRELGL